MKSGCKVKNKNCSGNCFYILFRDKLDILLYRMEFLYGCIAI